MVLCMHAATFPEVMRSIVSDRVVNFGYGYIHTHGIWYGVLYTLHVMIRKPGIPMASCFS